MPEGLKPGMTFEMRYAVTPERTVPHLYPDIEEAAVDGRKLRFSLEAFDDRDQISSGTHDRFIIDAGKFKAAVAEKGAGR